MARSRRDTRTAILSYLWSSKGAFRAFVAENVSLTEASVSRIIAELKAEGVVEETRRLAPYPGGPSVLVTLSNSINLAALEIANNRIHAAVGTPKGDILYSERYALPDGLDAGRVAAEINRAIVEMANWKSRREVTIQQIAVSIPGYHPDRRGNPIIALDPVALSESFEAELPGVPVAFANSIVTRAVAHRLHMGANFVGDPYLFVFVGHGVGAAFVTEIAGSLTVDPCEIGHMVLDPAGGRCRCGHFGCLETFVSTSALADILNVEEEDLIAQGDGWFSEFHVSSKARAGIRSRLARLGLAIGNTLNLSRQDRVIITGWPSTLPEGDRAEVMTAVESALLGGAEGVDLCFTGASFGREPASGLALSAFAFIRRGGERMGTASVQSSEAEFP